MWNPVIGSIGYLTKENSHLKYLKDNEVEIGYWISEDYWKKGICTEALKRLIKYCFEIKKYNVIWGTFFLDNSASGRVMEKCGFIKTNEQVYLDDLKEGKDKLVQVMKLEKKENWTKFIKNNKKLIKNIYIKYFIIAHKHNLS